MKKLSGHKEMIQQKRHERGISGLETIFVITIIVVVGMFATMSIARSRGAMRLASAATELAGYLERARGDSVRRHAGTTGSTAQANVLVINDSSYSVTLDFNSNGTLEAAETRVITLPDGVKFNAATAAGTTASFDWRGRTAAVNFSLGTDTYDPRVVSVSGSGDVAINYTAFTPTAVTAVSPSYKAGEK